MQTDPIADLLTRIRNGLRADHDDVEMPASTFKAEIARILAGRPGHIVVARPSYTPFSPAAFALIDQAVEGYELTCSIPFRVNERRTARALVYRTP